MRFFHPAWVGYNLSSRSFLIYVDVDASTSSAISVACSGSIVLVLSGKKIASPVRLQAQSPNRQYNPQSTKSRLASLISTLGSADTVHHVKSAVQTGFHGLWVVKIAATQATSAIYITAIKA